MNAGVAQGSALGPLFYLLCTADVPESVNILTATFANDTATTHRIETRQLPQGYCNRITIRFITGWITGESKLAQKSQTTLLLHWAEKIAQLWNWVKMCYPTIRLVSTYDSILTAFKPGTHIHKKRDEVNNKFRSLVWLLDRKLG